MRWTLLVLVGFFSVTVRSQTTNNPAEPTRSFFENLSLEPPERPAPALRELKPNELAVGPLTLEGIAVEAAKVEQPLHLLNPAAPDQYGTAEDNLVRDPIDGKPAGLKILGIRF